MTIQGLTCSPSVVARSAMIRSSVKSDVTVRRILYNRLPQTLVGCLSYSTRDKVRVRFISKYWIPPHLQPDVEVRVDEGARKQGDDVTVNPGVWKRLKGRESGWKVSVGAVTIVEVGNLRIAALPAQVSNSLVDLHAQKEQRVFQWVLLWGNEMQ